MYMTVNPRMYFSIIFTDVLIYLNSFLIAVSRIYVSPLPIVGIRRVNIYVSPMYPVMRVMYVLYPFSAQILPRYIEYRDWSARKRNVKNRNVSFCKNIFDDRQHRFRQPWKSTAFLSFPPISLVSCDVYFTRKFQPFICSTVLTSSCAMRKKEKRSYRNLRKSFAKLSLEQRVENAEKLSCVLWRIDKFRQRDALTHTKKKREKNSWLLLVEIAFTSRIKTL